MCPQYLCSVLPCFPWSSVLWPPAFLGYTVERTSVWKAFISHFFFVSHSRYDIDMAQHSLSAADLEASPMVECVPTGTARPAQGLVAYLYGVRER